MPVSKLTLKKRAAALKIKAAKAAAIHEHMRIDAEETAREAAELEAALLAAHLIGEHEKLGVETAVEPEPEPEMLISVQLPRTVWERFKDLW